MTDKNLTNDNPENSEATAARDRREQLAMWIFSGVIVLIILGGMGANMLWGHHDQAGTGAPTELSSQSRTTPSK
jgi:hypothetical protein